MSSKRPKPASASASPSPSSPAQPKLSKLEALLLTIGRPGRRQVISTFFLLYAFTLGVSTNYLVSFATMTPSHRCKLLEDWPWPDNVSFPLHHAHRHQVHSRKLVRYDSCHMYVDPSNHSLGVTTCPNGYAYSSVRNDGIERRTMSSEWDLVCEHKYLVRVFQFIYFAGVLFGGIIGGYLCDTFGRRTMWIATEIVFFVAGMSSAYFDLGYKTTCLFMFFLGMSMQSKIQSTIALTLEMFPSQYRTKVGIFTFGSPGISYGYATLISYLLPDWRTQIVVHVLLAFVAMPGMWFATESMRWLLAHGYERRALCDCRAIARFNGLALPPSFERDVSDVINEIRVEQTSSKKQTIADLLRYRTMRNYSFIMGFMAFTAHMSLYGFSFLMSEIGGDVYRNSLIVSVLDTTLRFASYFILKRCGRKKMTLICTSVMGFMQVAFITFRLLEHTLPVLRLLSIVASITARVFNGIFFCSFYILIIEVYPTTVRTTGQGLILASGRAGLMSTPIILFLSDYIWEKMPFVVFGVMAFTSTILCTFLPETSNQPLPNTIEEAVKLGGEKNKRVDSISCGPQLNLEERVALKTIVSS